MEALSSGNLAFDFLISEYDLPIILTRKKIGVTKAVSSLFQICVFYLYLKFGLMHFFN